MPTNWPALNTLAWLRLPCCGAEHPTRVEDFVDDNCVIGAPVIPHSDPVKPLDKKQGFFIGWNIEGGAFEVPVSLINHQDGDLPTWTIKANGPGEKTQRRNFVRLSVELEIQLFLIEGGATTAATTIDISEGGVKCHIDRWALDPGVRAFQMMLPFGDTQLLLRAQRAWWGPEQPDGSRDVGIKFLNLDPAIADKIRAYIFATQLEQRRKALE